MGQKPVKPQPNATAKKQTPLKPKKKPVVERKALRRPIALDEAVERVKASISMLILRILLDAYAGDGKWTIITRKGPNPENTNKVEEASQPFKPTSRQQVLDIIRAWNEENPEENIFYLNSGKIIYDKAIIPNGMSSDEFEEKLKNNIVVGATGYGQLINYIKCIGFPENKPLLTLIPGADTSKIQMPMQGDPNLNAPTSDDVMKKIAELFEIAKTNSRDIDKFAQDGVENSIHISSAKNRIQNLDQKMDKYDSITFAYMVISVVSAVVTVGVLIKFLFFM